MTGPGVGTALLATMPVVVLFFGGLGIGELAVIVLLLLLLFGSRRIPEIARGLGQGIRNFKSDLKDPEQLEDGEEHSEEENHEGR